MSTMIYVQMKVRKAGVKQAQLPQIECWPPGWKDDPLSKKISEAGPQVLGILRENLKKHLKDLKKEAKKKCLAGFASYKARDECFDRVWCRNCGGVLPKYCDCK